MLPGSGQTSSEKQKERNRSIKCNDGEGRYKGKNGVLNFLLLIIYILRKYYIIKW